MTQIGLSTVVPSEWGEAENLLQVGASSLLLDSDRKFILKQKQFRYNEWIS